MRALDAAGSAHDGRDALGGPQAHVGAPRHAGEAASGDVADELREGIRGVCARRAEPTASDREPDARPHRGLHRRDGIVEALSHTHRQAA